MLVEIYTAITNGYDDLKKQPALRFGRYTAFVDTPTRPKAPWHCRTLPESSERDPTRRARRVKALAHEHVPGAEYSLWIDGCFWITAGLKLDKLIDKALASADVATFANLDHGCTFEHGEFVIKAGLDDPRVVREQLERYRIARLPPHEGMVQTHVVLRRHTEESRRFNACWWREIERGSRRDQLSFIFAAREADVKVSLLDASDRQYFRGMSHRGRRSPP